jgi:hypothetical protein
MSKQRKSVIDRFIAMPDAEKDRIYDRIDAESALHRLARSRPLMARERKQWRRFKAKMGRPRIGKGTKTISLTVERDLLRKADAYARQHGISRARLVAQGLLAVMGTAA